MCILPYSYKEANMSIYKQQFRRIKSIKGSTALSTTAVNVAADGSDVTIYALTGSVWVNPDATAVEGATAIKLAEGDKLELNASGNISIISDATGATYQYIIWEV